MFATRSRCLIVVALLAVSVAGGCDRGSPGVPAAPTASPLAGGAAPAGSVGGVKPPAAADPAKPKVAPRKIAGDRQADAKAEPVRMSVQKESSPFRFAEIAKESGIDFKHYSGMTADRPFPSANGSGLAVFDYDNDGLLDLYFATATAFPIGSVVKGPNRLYRNLGQNKFVDVTEKAGVGFAGFCHAAVAGDIDNDGDQDLLLCNYGPNVLYLNNGDGTFKDISRSSRIGRPALVGAVEAAKPADSPESVVTVDAVAGPAWSLDGKTGPKIKLGVRKGARVVFRQADPDAPHGLTFRNPEVVQRLGEPEKPDALFKEVGTGESRLGVIQPALKKGAGPVVMAEFEVLKDIKESVAFHCTVFDRAWSSSAAFLDYDDDGDLDLYISNYGSWDYPEDLLFCGDTEANVRLYCSPRTVRTVRHFFYRNNGDHTFTEVIDDVIKSVDPETKRPRARSDGHGFCVVTADVNADGKIDIYVANDMNPNFLFLNNGDGTFEDATETSAAAYNEKGEAQSGMGADAEDVDGDGLPELYVTNFSNEYNTLYQNLGKGVFMDSTAFFGLASDTMPWVGWGTGLVDFDNDGWVDNFVSNGHVDDNRHALGQDVDYEEIPLLFANAKGKRFRLATRDAGPYFDAKHVGRGVAFGDIDNDGDVDILVNHKDGTPAFLRNDTKTTNHWLRLELRGTKSNRDAVGARVEVVAGARTIYRQRKGGYALESSNDPRVHVGVGPVTEVEKLTVRWPSGRVSTLENVKVDRALKIVEP